MIITIDGPTASGKSTTAAHLAARLDFLYINSGLLFRGLAYVFAIATHEIEQDENKKDFVRIFDSLLEQMHYSYDKVTGAAILFHEKNITSLLKTPEISTMASVIGTNEILRDLVTAWQRRMASGNNVVVEGRDAGSVVFPEADLKLFLTALLEVRAARWQKDQEQRGLILTLAEATQQIFERDERDSKRNVAPLIIPEGALVIDNGELTSEETVENIVNSVRSMLPEVSC